MSSFIIYYFIFTCNITQFPTRALNSIASSATFSCPCPKDILWKFFFSIVYPFFIPRASTSYNIILYSQLKSFSYLKLCVWYYVKIKNIKVTNNKTNQDNVIFTRVGSTPADRMKNIGVFDEVSLNDSANSGGLKLVYLVLRLSWTYNLEAYVIRSVLKALIIQSLWNDVLFFHSCGNFSFSGVSLSIYDCQRL